MEMPIEEKLEACREFRQKGNLFHEEGQYRRAALQYRQVSFTVASPLLCRFSSAGCPL